MKTRLWMITLVLGLLALPTLVQARPHLWPPDPELQNSIMEAMSLALLKTLDLTPAQRQEIRSLLTPLRPGIDAMREEQETWQKEGMKPRLARVIADLKSGRDPAPPDAQELKRFENHIQAMHDLKREGLEAMRDIMERLTPEQRKRLHDFDFEELIGFRPHAIMAGLFNADVSQLIQSLRGMSQEEFSALVERIRSHEPGHVRHGDEPAQGRFREERRTERREDLIGLMTEIRDMPQEEVDRRIEQLKERLGKLLPPGRHGAAEAGAGPAEREPERRGGDAPREMEGRGSGAGGPGNLEEGPRECFHIIFSKEFYELL